MPKYLCIMHICLCAIFACVLVEVCNFANSKSKIKTKKLKTEGPMVYNW